jgi:hypothetical protein
MEVTPVIFLSAYVTILNYQIAHLFMAICSQRVDVFASTLGF